MLLIFGIFFQRFAGILMSNFFPVYSVRVFSSVSIFFQRQENNDNKGYQKFEVNSCHYLPFLIS